MKGLLMSFLVGLGVGVIYGLLRVKSPAPPIIALIGLWVSCRGNRSEFGRGRQRSMLHEPLQCVSSASRGAASIRPTRTSDSPWA
jgi:XapX domain-containing protein